MADTLEDLFGDMGDDLASSPASLAQITETAEKAVNMQRQCDAVEAELKEMKGELRKLKEDILPRQMASLNLTKFSLADGTTIKVDDFVSGSIPKDPEKRDIAMAWLAANNGEGLIKTEVSISFGKAEHAKAVDVATDLKQRGLPVQMETGVHPMTLQSFARECMRTGTHIDLDALGLYVGRVAKIAFGKP